jgi:4-hydroxy-3-methylbut-2-enyl diphosphate reductase
MSEIASPTSGAPAADGTYVRKGFGLKAEVQDTLAADYTGHLVDLLRSRDYTLVAGETTVRLAKEFGFCYGVERAVDYAYQTRRKFPERRIFLAGEIIHNPHVNAKLKEMGVVFLPASGKGFDYSSVQSADVVILPAFGVTIQDFQTLRELGCVVVDTTCGSVLNVWKRVEVYARDGFTSLIHGKYYHEETRATASQVEKYPGGQYLVVRDMAEAEAVMDYIEAKAGKPTPRPTLSRDISIGSAWRIKPPCWRVNRWRSARRWARRWFARTARRTAANTSARLIRFAVRHRIGKTPWWSCWRSRSI